MGLCQTGPLRAILFFFFYFSVNNYAIFKPRDSAKSGQQTQKYF